MKALKHMNKALDFIVKQAGQISKKYSDSFVRARGDLLPFADILSAVRLMNR